MNKIKHRGLWLILALSTVLLVGFYGRVLVAPGHYMFNTAGDGLKNYFSFAWHAEHDTSFTTFSGMNYPFGEHIDYPDAQPLQSNMWRGLCKVFPALMPHTVAVVNLMMLASIVLCAVLLYWILRELFVPELLAVVFAVLISFMAPQVLRGTQAHYALAYGCAIPSAAWLMLRQWRSARADGWAIALLLLLEMWLFTHVYLGFIAAVLVLLCGVFAWVFRAAPRRNALGMVLAPLASLLIFLLWQKLTDTHVGRTLHPTGFFTYEMSFSTLLAPDLYFASPLWTKVIGLPAYRLAEGWSYIGLGTMLIFAVLLVVFVRNLLKGSVHSLIRDVFPARMAIMLAAGFLMLVFAFGLPFDPWFKDWLWHTPVIGQFRAPARFGWAFYFVITVWAARTAWVLWRRAAPGGIRYAASGMIVLTMALFASDMHYMNRYVEKRITEQPNYFDINQLPADMKNVVLAAKRVHARALVTLPYFHNGGEEFMVPADEAGLLVGQTVAQHTGLPLMTSSLTRTGVEEVRELIQGMGPDWYPKAIAARFQPNDTILIILSGSPMDRYDQATASHAHELMKSGPYTLMAITAKEMFANRAAERVQQFNTERGGFHHSGDWYFSKPDTFLVIDGFEAQIATHVRSGSGAFSGLKRDFNVLSALPAHAMDTAVTYLASFWYYNRGPMRCHAFVGIDDFDPVSGKGAWNYYTDPRFARTIVGDWSMVELPFRVGGKNHELKLFISGQPYDHDSIWVDDLSVRVADVDVYRVDSVSGKLWYNGNWIVP
ncbi:MAG: hypothetical protein JST38_04915 [Bacteroidetes bacterium]|nr:hypothetical protein [Bacteroidota bacterium]